MSEQQQPVNRITSIDVYRGLVMFLMLAEVLRISTVAKEFPDSSLWQFLKFHTTHVEWTGCSLHDMIQPSFSFLVGVALPFSIANRRTAGQAFGRALLHAVWRALLLIFLGVFLRSQNQPITNFTFVDTLTQIGLGYIPLFLLGWATAVWWRWGVFALILAGYWSAFALYSPGADFNPAAVTKAGWQHTFTGFAAHWNLNANPAWAFDTWFLNLFGREKPFTHVADGYATLNFIPTLATMILGLVAGEWLRGGLDRRGLILRLFLSAGIGIGLGYGLDVLGWCPIVKKIWTPAWTLYSGGICFAILLGCVLLFDFLPLRAVGFPVMVIGANSIVAYCMSWTIKSWVIAALSTHTALLDRRYGIRVFEVAGKAYAPLLQGACVLAIFWLILFWMYRRRVFIRI